MKENEPYEFRVAAVNDAGQGEWSDVSDAILASWPPSAPRIDWDNFRMRDITVRAGEKFELQIPFKGSPQPTARWSRNFLEFTATDDRVYHEVTETYACFRNSAAKREEAGKYTVVLTNSFGSDTATCNVNVVDVPGIPVGPLEPVDTTPNSCRLRWQPPADDGGSPLTNYVVEKADSGSNSWTKVSGYARQPEYEVFGLEPNKRYHFRVRAENVYGVSEPLETDCDVLAAYPFNEPGAPRDARVTDMDRDSVTLVWDRPTDDGGNKIKGYLVEARLAEVDEPWKQVNKSLCKDQNYTVPRLIENKKYEFRVKAVNDAGAGKPSDSTGAVLIRRKFTVPEAPGIPDIVKIGRSYVDLKWAPPVSDGGSKITGYMVERREPAGTWKKVFDYNVDELHATVMQLDEGKEYEFRVMACNAAGVGKPSMATMPIKVKDRGEVGNPEIVRKFKPTSVSMKPSFNIRHADRLPLGGGGGGGSSCR